MGGSDAWAHPSLQLPGYAPGPANATSAHPLLIGASPGTTGTMSLYRALVLLGVSAVHYSREFDAASGVERDTYARIPPGGPVPLLRPLFTDAHPAPPVNLTAGRTVDLRFLEATDALLDTPAMEVLYNVLATFPRARVVVTARDPLEWAASRRARHPTDRAPLFPLLGFDAPMSALSVEQSAMALALWHRAVAASVPPSRLLLLDVFTMRDEELWERLCAFLQRPLPRDASGLLLPFPHEHYGDDVRRHFRATPNGKQIAEDAAPPM
jgi:hypothetical protein